MTKITVLTTDINVVSINNEDYICITDMLKAKDGDFFISDWLRNRNTLNTSVYGSGCITQDLIMANSPQLEISRG